MKSTELVDQVLDDKYRIERLLGRGGMGAVYLATHLGTSRLVALKVIAPQFMMNDEFVERFKREARAAGRFRHPNVVDVTDFGFAQAGESRVAYLVMEYLDGCSLAEVLAEESRLPLEWVTDILDQACSAVDEAHKQGVIHRDLKPDNIWLEPNRRGGYTVKVLDFGLAKLGDAAADDLPALPASTSLGPSLSRAPDSRARSNPDSGGQHSAQPHSAQLHSAQPHSAQSRSDRTASPVLSVRSGDQSLLEAVTLAQPAPAAEEQETRILIQEMSPEEELSSKEELLSKEELSTEDKSDAEADTRILPPEEEEGATLVQPSADAERSRTPVAQHKTIDERARETAPADGLTRVGSILGTPLYMSPEQCRSEPLDTRSDIYSLGVIAYQMLVGSPPFTGDMNEVMRLHITAAPPPLREKNKKVPKKTAAIVMQALAKSPDQRPTSAAGFASALRASTEGTGTLMRRAIALYSEHFPKFFRVSLLAYLPVIALSLLQLIFGIMNRRGALPPVTAKVLFLTIAILKTILTFLASSIIAGMTIRLVTQLFLAPLRSLELRPAFAALKRRLRPFLGTTLLVGLLGCLGFLLLIVPGVIFYINASLTASVVMMENLKGWAAIRRSKALVKRSRRTVIAILFIQYITPILAGSVVMAIVLNFFKGMPQGRAELFGHITDVFVSILNVLIIPFIATLSALLYLKTRQMGGETLKEALSQFESEDVPQTDWQRRMRERLHTPTHITR